MRRPARTSRNRRRARTERGASIVEVMVASLILSVGIIGLATLFLTSAQNGAIARSQADANDIAVSELEAIRVLDYDTVGIDPSASGYVPRVDGRNTVTELGRNAVVPESSVERDGVTFDVERSVTWQGDPDDVASYKVVTITVTWSANGLERDVVVQTGLYEVVGDA